MKSSYALVIDCLNPKPVVDYEQKIKSVLELMRETGNFILPVFKSDKFTGVVTETDIIDYLFEYQRKAHNELENRVEERTSELVLANDQLRREIKERKRMEKEFIQTDKMISLGILVSGVAHEINNPNNFIMLNTPILQEAWEDIMPVIEKYYKVNNDFVLAGLPYSTMRDEIPKLFSGIKEGSKRIKHIVKDLKNYARQGGSDMDQSVNINQIVKNSVRLVDNLIKKATNNFRVEYGHNLPLIEGNKQKLGRVVINLIRNACQALEDKEKGVFMKSSFDKKKNCIVIQVQDEGCGIPETTLPRIMDPFFTTKRSQRGTGLSLPVSSVIVKAHGGRIEVKSDISKGTIFKVILPVNRIKLS